jgi:hypothetical protein
MSNQIVSSLYGKIQDRKNSGYTYLGTPVYNVSQNDLKKLSDISKNYGFPVEWLANLINHETAGTWNPAITNSIGATGLIQFIPSTADSLGTSTDKLRKMTFGQQLDYVDKYLLKVFKNKKLLLENGNVKPFMTQGDLFMMIFYPAAIGNPEYVFPANVRAANSVSNPKEYTQKALKNAVFGLDEAPFSLEEYLRKYATVSPSFIKSKKRWWILPVGIIIFGSGLIAAYWYIKNKK